MIVFTPTRRANPAPRDATLSIPPARLLRLFTPPVAARILALLERDDREAQQREPRS